MPTITVGELVTGSASERIPLSQSYRLHSEFILPRMGSLVAAELTTKDVRSLLADYQARGVSNASVNRLKSCLSSILSRGVRLELIEENICRRIPALAHKTPKARTLTSSEADQLLRVCRDSKWDKLYLLVLMALTTAGRKGELLGIALGADRSVGSDRAGC